MLSEIGEHPLGELRMGLADVHRSLGDLEKSKIHLEAVMKELPNTEYAKEAEKWLAAKPTAKLAHNCIELPFEIKPTIASGREPYGRSSTGQCLIASP